MKRNKVAFIMHPLNVLDFRSKTFFYAPFEAPIDWILRNLPPNQIKKLFSNLPPHVFLNLMEFTTVKGSSVDILGVMCPMFPDEIISDKNRAFLKVKRSVFFAINRGATVIVLAGFTSIVGNQGAEIKDAVFNAGFKNVVVTSGNTLTAALCIKSIENLIKFFGLAEKNLTTAVIGATGDIGSVCVRILAARSKKIILCARNINKDSDIYREISGKLSQNIILERDVRRSVLGADIVIIATSSVFPIIQWEDLRKKSIVCDVSLPHNLTGYQEGLKYSVFGFDGGKAKAPKAKTRTSKKWQDFLNCFQGIPGCLAEGLLLGLENKMVDFSLGRGNITNEKVDLIYGLARQHGFDIADYTFHERRYTQDELNSFKKIFGN